MNTIPFRSEKTLMCKSIHMAFKVTLLLFFLCTWPTLVFFRFFTSLNWVCEEESKWHHSCCSIVKSCLIFATPWTAACQTSLSSTISQSLLKFTSIGLVMLSNPPYLLLLSSPFAFNLSWHQGLFQWVGSLHQVARVLMLQLCHQSLQCIFRVEVPSRFIFWKVVDLFKNFSDILIGGFGNAYGFHSRRSLARKWWNWTNHRSDSCLGLLEELWQWDPGQSTHSL